MFRLSTFYERLRIWLTESGSYSSFVVVILTFRLDVIQPKHYLSQTLQYLRPDEQLSISRHSSRLKWGIGVPNDREQTVALLSCK